MHRFASLIFVSLLSVIVAAPVSAQTTTKSATKSVTSKSVPRPDFPSHTTVLKGYDKVVSTNNASRSVFFLSPASGRPVRK